PVVYLLCVHSSCSGSCFHTSFCLFFFYCSGAHRDLHSFPTRRSSDLRIDRRVDAELGDRTRQVGRGVEVRERGGRRRDQPVACEDRKSTRLNSSHVEISYAVFCLKKKNKKTKKMEQRTRRKSR